MTALLTGFFPVSADAMPTGGFWLPSDLKRNDLWIPSPELTQCNDKARNDLR
jgi:hypothetical protein